MSTVFCKPVAVVAYVEAGRSPHSQSGMGDSSEWTNPRVSVSRLQRDIRKSQHSVDEAFVPRCRCVARQAARSAARLVPRTLKEQQRKFASGKNEKTVLKLVL